VSTSATNGWSVINVMRFFRVNTKAAVIAQWVGRESTPPDIHGGTTQGGNVTLPSTTDVDDGVNYLVGAGFATYDAGTDVITSTRLDTDGRPARLRRVVFPPDPEAHKHLDTLEYLPSGAQPTEGT